MADPGKERWRLKIVLGALRRLLGKKPTPPPGDPHAYTMAPVRRGPKGRSGAAGGPPQDESLPAYPPRSEKGSRTTPPGDSPPMPGHSPAPQLLPPGLRLCRPRHVPPPPQPLLG